MQHREASPKRCCTQPDRPSSSCGRFPLLTGRAQTRETDMTNPLHAVPPVVSGVHGPWRRWIDTYQDAPHDIYDWPGGPAVEGPNYTVQARSLVVLFALGGNRPRLAGGVVHEGLS